MLKAFAGLLCLGGSAGLLWAGKPGGPLHALLVRRRALGDLYTLAFVAMAALSMALLVHAALN
jgi:hypothetical protein